MCGGGGGGVGIRMNKCSLLNTDESKSYLRVQFTQPEMEHEKEKKKDFVRRLKRSNKQDCFISYKIRCTVEVGDMTKILLHNTGVNFHIAQYTLL